MQTPAPRTWLRRQIPPLRWRDEKLEAQRRQIATLEGELRRARTPDRDTQRTVDLEAELAALRAREQRPSFHREVLALRRSPQFAEAVDPQGWLPTVQLPYKLRNYRLAASHGIDVPRILGSWSSISDITFEGLPEGFVLKSDGGASGDGVFAVETVDEDRFRLLDNGRILTAEDIRRTLKSRGRKARGPYFVEELLAGESPGTLPDDVKIYSFYGEVAQILLRRVQPRGDGRLRVSWRFIDSDGRSLDVGAPDRVVDDTVPTPDQLAPMVRAARHLSRAVGTPFCRVDVYGTGRGVVLGEITRAPGGQQIYSDSHDERLGRTFALAAARLELDLVRGRPPGVLHGDHPATNWYPPDHPSQSEDPGPWGTTVRPCSSWCLDR